MEITDIIKQNIRKAIKKEYSVEIEDIHIEHPENENHGDYATNIAMLLAKKLKVPPVKIAEKLAYLISDSEPSFEIINIPYPVFSKIEAVQPGFINFTLSERWLEYNLCVVLEQVDRYGSSKKGKNKKVIVEYSQPNPNKPLHIGHTRNNSIGSSLSKIFKFAGYDVLAVNYINDWGTHVCKSMLMYMKKGGGKEPDKKPDQFVGDFYIMYEQEEERNPSIKEELADLFRKLESGDPQTVILWKKITGWAYEGWKETYRHENVEFDVWMHQSDYRDSGKEIVRIALEKGIAEKDSSGAIIARMEKYGIPDKVLLRADGTSIYSTQDLQLAKDSYEKYNFDERLYVVDYRQSDYFRQIFKILQVLGFDWAQKLRHVSYGTVDLPEGKMSSRKGLVISSDKVFDKIKELEEIEISKSSKREKVSPSTVEAVALSALKYSLLKVDLNQDIVFQLDQVTKFDGNTGPYLLYTFARIKSVLEKSGLDYEEKLIDYTDLLSLKLHEKELAVLRSLYKFPEEIDHSVDNLTPNNIANFLYILAQKYNSFYGDVPIISSKDKLEREFRILLSNAVSIVLKNGLSLLGIRVVDKM